MTEREEKMRAALESIAGWRKVNIAGEYEHGLRDIIRAISDCAATALEAAPRSGDLAQVSMMPISQDAATIAQTAHVIINRLTEENERLRVAQAPRQPTDSMLNAAREWSREKYGKPIGNDGAIGCWQAMFDASLVPSTESKWSFPGCRDRDSCHRHGECMYVGCPHNIARLSTMTSTEG